jgi:hypothetical protein
MLLWVSLSFGWFCISFVWVSVLKIIKNQIQTLSISLNIFLDQLNPLYNLSSNIFLVQIASSLSIPFCSPAHMAIFSLLGLFARSIPSAQFFPTSARLTRQPTPLSITASRALPIGPSPSSSTLAGPDSCQCAATGHPWPARLAYVVIWLALMRSTLHPSRAPRHATRLTLVYARPWPPTSRCIPHSALRTRSLR